MDQSTRQAIAAAFEDAARQSITTKSFFKVQVEADRFRHCGRRRRVYECPKDRHKFGLPCSCNSRLCPECSRRYARQFKEQLLRELSPWWTDRQKTYGPKFLTLTFQRSRFAGEIVSPREIGECFRQVRQFIIRYYHKYQGRRSRNGSWYSDRRKFRGCGALSLVEISPGGAVHFHVLVYGPFIPQRLLSAAWYQVSGDSSVVDIRKVESPAKAVAYVLKYMAKLPGLDSFRSLAEWALALKGRRRFTTAGVLYGRVRRSPRRREKMLCLLCGERLRYAGDYEDPQGKLIDYLTLKKYCEPQEGKFLHTWLYNGPGAPDLTFDWSGDNG